MEDQLSLFNDMTLLKDEIKIEVKNKIIDDNFVIGEKVRINYQGKDFIGTVKRIYNNSETINCSFDNEKRHTAFYYKNVLKI